MNPYEVIDTLEKRIAEWAGSKYAIAVESASAAILLCLFYRREINGFIGEVTIPSRTYPSCPCSIIIAGGKVKFDPNPWQGHYELHPLRIWDSALRFHNGMYTKEISLVDGLMCLSFHIRKRLNLGRGGMILTDNEQAYKWLKLARFDGREPVPLKDQKEFNVIGLNAYMQPADGARAIQLFELLRGKDLSDLSFDEQGYADLSLHKIYQK